MGKLKEWDKLFAPVNSALQGNENVIPVADVESEKEAPKIPEDEGEEPTKEVELPVEEEPKISEPTIAPDPIPEGQLGNFPDMLQKLVADDVIPQLVDEEGEAIDFKGINTYEDLKGVLQTVIDAEKEEAKKGTLDKSGIPDQIIKIAELSKVDGDTAILQEVAQLQEKLKKPFEGLDLTDVRHAAHIVKVALINKGNSERDAITLIKAKAHDELKKEASDYVDAYSELYDKMVEEKIQAKEQQQKDVAKSRKEFRKILDTELGQKGYKGTQKKSILSSLTQYEAGKRPIEGLIEEVLKDEKKAIELAEFIMFPETHYERKFSKTKADINLNTAKKRTLKYQPKSMKPKGTTKKTTATKKETETSGMMKEYFPNTDKILNLK